jgi:SOS-response transcriptional repressor LexA
VTRPGAQSPAEPTLVGTPPTDRQREVLRLIATGINTRRDLAAAIGVTSSAGAQDHLVALRKRGLVDWPPRRSAAVRLTSEGWQVLGPCKCVDKAIFAKILVVAGNLRIRIPGSTAAELCYCPWCGWRLW